jgi:hypothetical protein
MGFSDVMTGKYQLAHSGTVSADKLGQVADLLGMKKKAKEALLKAGKTGHIHLVHEKTARKRKAKAKAT